MKTVEKIKELMRNASNIRVLFNTKIPDWAKNKSYYDKTGAGFNLDSRFAACASISIHFDSWMGIYGNSGCSSQCDLDKDIFGHHLLKYLNANKQTIMLAIADQIEKEAGELKAKAQEELKKAMDELESVDKQEKQ